MHRQPAAPVRIWTMWHAHFCDSDCEPILLVYFWDARPEVLGVIRTRSRLSLTADENSFRLPAPCAAVRWWTGMISSSNWVSSKLGVADLTLNQTKTWARRRAWGGSPASVRKA